VRACKNRQRYQTDGLPCWREEILISTQLRLAAGICVLSTGLLIGSGGGAIAAATPDTSATGNSVDSASTDSASETPGSTAPTPGSTLQKTVTKTLTFLGKLGQQQAAATKRLLTPPPTKAQVDSKDPALTEETAAPLALDTTEVAPESMDASLRDDVMGESVTDPMAPLTTVVAPVTNAVVTVVGVMGTVPGFVVGLPRSETPVTDVITTVETMLTSVTDAVLPLASVPSDLYTMLAATAVPTATIGGGAGFGVGPAAPPDGPLLSSGIPAWLQGPQSTDLWTAPGVSAPTLGEVVKAALGQELSISGAAPVASESVIPSGVLPALEHAVSALLVPASLSALAALALPGVAGLLIVCAAGIRLGYRQAKAGVMLRVSGIAQFAGSGPLGVVRSGALIALHPRGVRDKFRAVSPPAGFLEQAG
jgi:hypothetical protein